MSGAFLASLRYAPGLKAIGIESRWGPPDLDQMSEDMLQLVGILDDGDHLHVRTALWAHKRIDLIDLRKQSGPCAFTWVSTDLFVFIRQRLEVTPEYEERLLEHYKRPATWK